MNSGREAEELLAELQNKLLQLQDPRTGQLIITRVDRSADVYTGPYRSEAPDLLIGYNRGYRVGWDSVLGKFSWHVLEDNKNPWSGDHCIDYTLVPGVLLSSKKIQKAAPALTDLAPTILAEFGIEKPAEMVGHSLFASERGDGPRQ